MKLKVVRMSGRPVSMENLEKYEQEFKKEYDKIQAEVGLDMLKFYEQLKLLDEKLGKKYDAIQAESIPKSAKGWHALVQKYQAPLMLAQSSENPKELVLVVMDEALV